MAKKYKAEKIGGVKVVVKLNKDHERPMMPPPSKMHASKRDYNRRKEKAALKKSLSRGGDFYFCPKRSFF